MDNRMIAEKTAGILRSISDNNIEIQRLKANNMEQREELIYNLVDNNLTCLLKLDMTKVRRFVADNSGYIV